MSFIQKIRDKYARVSVIAIAIALLGFILMDALAGKGSGGTRETTIGKINGKEIEADAFMRRVNEISKRQGQQGGEIGTEQAVNGLWQQELNDAIMGKQYEELGLTITSKELDQLLFGQNPPQEFRQAFSNPQTPGQWDPGAVRQQFNSIKKSGTPEQKQQLNELIEYVEKQALLNKYNALLTSSVYIPKWFLDKRNIDNSQMAKAAFVSVPYTSIADSTVKVTDAEINNYVQAHKKDYELKEETRSISYVQFNANASAADSAKVKSDLMAAKDSFQATTNVKEFLIQNRSLAQYSDTWISANDLTLQNKDSIFKTPTGVVGGPFAEPGAMLLSKILGSKTQPDTAKVRHILIATATQDPQTGQFVPTRDTLLAKKTADSIQSAIAGGAIFDSVMVKLSDDPSKAINKGVFDSITRNAQLVPEFKDFALNNPVGFKGVVKTQFGYHYMEVLNQRGSSPVYKLAFFALPIEASSETVSQANNDATLFAGNSKDEKSFNDYFEKNLKAKGLTKGVASNLRPMDFSLTGLAGSSRELIKEVFTADKGDVLDPKLINNNYVVAVVTDVEKAGVPSANSVRAMIEPVLRNKKKADQIKAQMGKINDLNTVATKFNQQVQPADSVRFSGGGALGYETKVLGALFNPANKGKVCPEGIAGQAGVYAIRVDATFTGAVENADIEAQRKMLEMQARQQFRSPVEVLQKKADIKDYRAKFY
ncbi:MAG TPA: SurA N-terminal domain-containing protein [Flavisolibacter sp.]|jgi:peptidyl-prolyl cis-trans isomerase D|nr:SurA N-terminal domain-containing protein [Flavisolibacter sp.]